MMSGPSVCLRERSDSLPEVPPPVRMRVALVFSAGFRRPPPAVLHSSCCPPAVLLQSSSLPLLPTMAASALLLAAVAASLCSGKVKISWPSHPEYRSFKPFGPIMGCIDSQCGCSPTDAEIFMCFLLFSPLVGRKLQVHLRLSGKRVCPGAENVSLLPVTVCCGFGWWFPKLESAKALILPPQPSDVCSECSHLVQLSANMVPSRDAKARTPPSPDQPPASGHACARCGNTFHVFLQEMVYETLHALCQRLPKGRASDCDAQVKTRLPEVLQQAAGRPVSSSTTAVKP